MNWYSCLLVRLQIAWTIAAQKQLLQVQPLERRTEEGYASCLPPIRVQIRRYVSPDHLPAWEIGFSFGRSGDIVAGQKMSKTGIRRVKQNHDLGESAFHFHLAENTNQCPTPVNAALSTGQTQCAQEGTHHPSGPVLRFCSDHAMPLLSSLARHRSTVFGSKTFTIIACHPPRVR